MDPDVCDGNAVFSKGASRVCLSPRREACDSGVTSRVSIGSCVETVAQTRVTVSPAVMGKVALDSDSTNRRSRVSLSKARRESWREVDDDPRVALAMKSLDSQSITGTTPWDAFRRCAKAIVRHSWFDASMGMIIMSNAVCIAVEQELLLADAEQPWLQAAEHVFLFVYILELALRAASAGRAALRDKWFTFDMSIVFTSIVTQWILVHIDVEQLRLLVIMRLARLARLLRAARLLIDFRSLWILVNGLIASSGIMLYTCGLIFGMLLAFAMLGVELIAIRHGGEGTDDEEVNGIVYEYFGGIWPTMLTLTQFVSLDSIAAIYRPLVLYDPPLAAYFTFVFLAIGILLMNLITAVCVNEALEQCQQNKEAAKHHVLKQKKKAVNELRALFSRIDGDSSGSVCLDEILNSADEDLEFVKGFVKETSIHEVFHILDIDGDGSLDIDEFCEGLWQTLVTPTPLDFKRLDKRIEGIRGQIDSLRDMQCQLLSAVNEVKQKLNMTSSTSPRSQPTSEPPATDTEPQHTPLFTDKAEVDKDGAKAEDVLLELRDVARDLKLQLATARAEDAMRTLPQYYPLSFEGTTSNGEAQTSTEGARDWRVPAEESRSSGSGLTRRHHPRTIILSNPEWCIPAELGETRAVRPTATPMCPIIAPSDMQCGHMAP